MVEIVDELFALPMNIAMLLWYPVASVIQLFLWLLNAIYTPFATLLNTIINIGTILIDVSTNIISNLYPGLIGTVIGTCITAILILRIYSFLKDIEILGNKV